jgi:ATP synthase protein I
MLRRAVAAAARVGELTLLTLAGFWLGSWLDGRLGTGPWLFFLGTLMGFLAGTFALFQGLAKFQSDDEDQDDPPA